MLALGLDHHGPRSPGMAMGMHLAVLCSEDKLSSPRARSFLGASSADFDKDIRHFYQTLCEQVPTQPVPPGFDTLQPSDSPTLLLSGANDPVTPPRHAQRVVKALGPQAHHVIVPHAAHGTLGLSCVNEAVFHFINTEDPSDAHKPIPSTGACAALWPRPRVFVMTGNGKGATHD